jgi:hypothetical protein
MSGGKNMTFNAYHLCYTHLHFKLKCEQLAHWKNSSHGIQNCSLHFHDMEKKEKKFEISSTKTLSGLTKYAYKNV